MKSSQQAARFGALVLTLGMLLITLSPLLALVAGPQEDFDRSR